MIPDTPKALIEAAEANLRAGRLNMGETYMRAACAKIDADRLQRNLELPIFRAVHAATN